MEENILIKILEKQENERKLIPTNKWGISQRNRLVNVLEAENVYISENLWDLLLFNINELMLDNNKLLYSTSYKPSKKVNKLLDKHKETIISNFNFIINGE